MRQLSGGLMKVLYGTTNQAKIDAMRKVANTVGFEIIGLKDLNKPILEVDESGKNPLENAKIKAQTYFEAFSMPVFSCDSGLFFDEIEEELQPGTHIRRVNGKELSDEEMIIYYSNLARIYGGQLHGRYRNGIYFIMDQQRCYSSMDLSIATDPFILVCEAHSKRVKGFPLDSLSKDIYSGEYYYDMEKRTLSNSTEYGFQNFFETIFKDQK